MKRTLLTLSLAIGIVSSGLMAQNAFFPQNAQTEQEKAVEQQRMEIFAGATAETLPHVPAHKLSDWADRTDKVFQEPNWWPLSSNPALYNAVKAKSVTNTGTDNLSVEATLAVSGWGSLSSTEDGTQMLYSIEPIPSNVVYGTQQYYKGIRFTYYNDSLKPIKEFELYSNTDTTQTFSIMTQYSSRVFNTDNKLEFVIQAHSFSGGFGLGPISCRDTIYVVNEDGEILAKRGSTQGLNLHQAPSGYSTENRALITRSNYSPISDTAHVEVWNTRDLLEPDGQPLHVFSLANNLTSYTEGPFIETMEIEGDFFYVVRHNQKPFVANGDQMNPVVEKNNRYMIDIYNPDFSLAKSIALPLIGQDENEWSVGSQLYFDKYRLTRHTFNGDDKFEVLYGMSRYVASCDCNILYFYLMDEDGNMIKELLPDGLSGMTRLQDIPGQNTQYGLWMDNGGGITAVGMYDIDAQEFVYTFPARHNGFMISLNYDRIPDKNGSYEYVFGLGSSEAGENTTYGLVAHYDTEGNELKRVRIDLGPNAASFQPILNVSTLNPYAFISDEKLEYLWFAREYYVETGSYGGGFGMSNEDSTLYVWRISDGLPLDGAGVLADATRTKLQWLYVSYVDVYGESKTDFYRLPLDEPSLQGEGTEENPYIITNPVELDLVRNHPDAWFELGNDIDMSAFSGVSGSGFPAIETFSGHFDGKNHYIKNITIHEHEGNAGLFANVNNGSIQNLLMKNVSFTLNDPYYIGCIAASLTGDLKNCHVEADFEILTDATVGGLAGTVMGSIDQCSFSGTMNITGDATTGGITGQLMAQRSVTNSTTSGAILGTSNTAGGIVGSTMMNASIRNCHSGMDVTAVSYAGGIVGDNRGFTENAYATGSITSLYDETTQWHNNMAGGIAGNTQLGMMPGYVKHSFALNDTIVSPIDYARVANADYYSDYSGNIAMDSNYAVNTLLVGPRADSLYAPAASDTMTQANRKHGQTGTLEEFNQAFYEANTWTFGQDSLAPWVMSGNMPRLWFEFNVRAVELPFAETSIEKGSSLTLLPTIIPADATDKTCRFSSSDVAIASVNQDGVVTGNNAGTATITVTTNDGGFTASCQVHVTIPVEQVILAEDTVTTSPYGTLTLEYTVLPEEATNQHVLFRSANEGIVMCYGSTLMGVAVGTTQVIAVSEDGHASDTCVVNVIIPIEDITLNESSITLNNATPSFQLRATLYPEDATEVPLVWTSGDESVATVNSNGLVSGHAKGSTTVTVSTPDGEHSASCYVTVSENVANEGTDASFVSGRLDKGDFLIESSCDIRQVSVFNMAGSKVYEDLGVASGTLRIPAQHLADGLYLILVELDNGQTASLKIAK